MFKNLEKGLYNIFESFVNNVISKFSPNTSESERFDNFEKLKISRKLGYFHDGVPTGMYEIFIETTLPLTDVGTGKFKDLLENLIVELIDKFYKGNYWVVEATDYACFCDCEIPEKAVKELWLNTDNKSKALFLGSFDITIYREGLDREFFNKFQQFKFDIYHLNIWCFSFAMINPTDFIDLMDRINIDEKYYMNIQRDYRHYCNFWFSYKYPFGAKGLYINVRPHEKDEVLDFIKSKLGSYGYELSIELKN